ncbi:uncharacterized protein At4g00950-like [Diospyros lotus]|uniref:uncharacterized protein At4g00950-like n=1 Tax=Diospyros lotus TaxID=55363 RepID=UPI00225601BC|nr:uncharacterized protein At4g00950-like [Diospyros lotus]
MGSKPITTPPKLSLFSLPTKPPESPGMVTPPLRTKASVPFQWEEAPGKPLPNACQRSAPRAARCLELPPRLLNEAGITGDMSSPTTVLDGPYNSSGRRSLSQTASFRSLGSWRWGSFKENGEGDGGGSFDFTPSAFGPTKTKMEKLRKRSSFMNYSSKSRLWPNSSSLSVGWAGFAVSNPNAGKLTRFSVNLDFITPMAVCSLSV